MEKSTIAPLRARDLEPCILCERGLGHDNQITFHRLTIDRFVIDAGNVQRHDGLERMFGGGQVGAVMADIMGPGLEIARSHQALSATVLICETCAMSREITVWTILEAQARRLAKRFATTTAGAGGSGPAGPTQGGTS